MSTGAEKLVKQTIKLLAKTQELDYEELKVDAKKVIRMARVYDSELLAIMEELMELSNVGSIEELMEFNIEVLRIYCKIKDLEDSGSDKHIRQRVWEHIESEFELDTEDGDEDGDDDESVVESGSESEDEEEEREVVIKESEPVVIKKKKEKVTISE